jgi:hypothetical protein
VGVPAQSEEENDLARALYRHRRSGGRAAWQSRREAMPTAVAR